MGQRVNMGKTLAVVGAGAKAAAIAARAAALRELGASGVPEIVVFEQDHVGAAWSGKGGYSSGYLTLCTPAEKDMGFPYDDPPYAGTVEKRLAATLFSRFSWPAYQVAGGGYSEWVDRGRDYPSHAAWARYLKWVFAQAAQSVTIARVTAVHRKGGRWYLSFVEDGKEKSLTADGVVLTGTGQSRAIPCDAAIPAGRVFDSETFWPARAAFLQIETGTIAVAGDGGAAGTIVAWLAERLAEQAVRILSVNPLGTLLPRGDGHAERRWFSAPEESEGWASLSLDDRRKLIDRTEAGVISMRNKRLIDRSSMVEYVKGKVRKAQWDEDEIKLMIQYGSAPAKSLAADYFISAIGFDRWSLLGLIDEPAVEVLLDPKNESLRDLVERDMQADLSLPPVSGLRCEGMHVPALASLAHGPGMANLGCLGLMAARVLKQYLD